MLHETHASVASVKAYVAQTGLRQVSRVYIAWQNFLENFADSLDEAWVKIIHSSSGCWQRFLTATSANELLMLFLLRTTAKNQVLVDQQFQF